MTKKDWRSACSVLKKHINLAASPIGIALFTSAREILAFPSVKLLTKTAPCHMAAIARYYREDGVVGASSEGIVCLLGLSCIGLIKTPARVEDGILNQRFTSGPEAAGRLNDSIKMIGNGGKRYDALIIGPLDLMPTDPQVIAVYVTPAQALRLVIGFAYREGEAITSTITGQGSLCASMAKALDENGVVVDIPCVGDRAYGYVQEHELVVTFPASKIDDLITGLKATESTAGHPFRPFLSWPVILWPEFEPRKSDLG